MLKNIKLALAGIVMMAIAGSVFVPAVPAFAVNTKDALCQGVNGSDFGSDESGNPGCQNISKNDDLGAVFKRIVNILLFIIGAVAVVVIVIGGFRYVTSAGNAASVTAAKNTILYAVIGLAIAIFAYAIVNFVIGNV